MSEFGRDDHERIPPSPEDEARWREMDEELALVNDPDAVVVGGVRFGLTLYKPEGGELSPEDQQTYDEHIAMGAPVDIEIAELAQPLYDARLRDKAALEELLQLGQQMRLEGHERKKYKVTVIHDNGARGTKFIRTYLPLSLAKKAAMLQYPDEVFEDDFQELDL